MSSHPENLFPHRNFVAPKVAGKHKRGKQPECAEARPVHWWIGKNLQDLVACFKKELALFLKGSFIDSEHRYQRKFLYFQRNYAEVPGLLERCNGIIESINRMVEKHSDKVLSSGPSSWRELMGEGEEDVLGLSCCANQKNTKAFCDYPAQREQGPLEARVLRNSSRESFRTRSSMLFSAGGTEMCALGW